MLVIVPLVAIFIYLIYKGANSLNLAFFTQNPVPEGESGGGMANAIVGSGVLLGIASAIGVPIGIGAEFTWRSSDAAQTGQRHPLYRGCVEWCSFDCDGPGGIFADCGAHGHFSAFSGGVALGIMMIPTVARTSEEMLLMVPNTIREAALGLGLPNWRSVLSITVKTASPGIITGCMLAFARVAGETAPLIFTALGNSSGAQLRIGRLKRCHCRFGFMQQARMRTSTGSPGRALVLIA